MNSAQLWSCGRFIIEKTATGHAITGPNDYMSARGEKLIKSIIAGTGIVTSIHIREATKLGTIDRETIIVTRLQADYRAYCGELNYRAAKAG